MKIKLLNKQWEIKELNAKELAELLTSDSSYNMGGCDYMGKKIGILDNLRDETKHETIIHEITHAIMYESSLNAHCKEDVREQYCEFVKFAYPIIEDVLKQIDKKA